MEEEKEFKQILEISIKLNEDRLGRPLTMFEKRRVMNRLKRWRTSSEKNIYGMNRTVR